MEFTSQAESTPVELSSVRGLYGGAIEATLPSEYEDVSKLREVPDHQEVFLNQLNESSLIVELLDLDQEQTENEILRYYFHDLSKHNESESTKIYCESLTMPDDFMPGIGPSHPRYGLIGKQFIRKYRSEHAHVDEVYVLMVLIRLRNVGTDVLITMNIPKQTIEESSKPANPTNEGVIEQSIAPEELWEELFANSSIFYEPLVAENQKDTKDLSSILALRLFLSTFVIKDWSLFL